MTQKEKAEELVNKMNAIHYIKLHGKNKDSKGLPVSMHYSQQKQCAITAIDEVIKYAQRWGDMAVDDIKEFEQLKQEIEKL